MLHCAIISTTCVFTSQVNEEGNKKSVSMNRTDRLLAIILELQGKGRQRAEDLEVGQGMNMNGLEGAMAMEADQLN